MLDCPVLSLPAHPVVEHSPKSELVASADPVSTLRQPAHVPEPIRREAGRLGQQVLTMDRLPRPDTFPFV